MEHRHSHRETVLKKQMNFASNHPHDANPLSQQVRAVIESQLPLASGLRAIAAEWGDRETARRLERLADALERGQTVEQAVQSTDGRLPALQQLFLSRLQPQDRIELAMEIVDQQRKMIGLRREVFRSLIYPSLLLFLGTMLAFGAPMLFASSFSDLFSELQVKLSRSTTWAIIIGTRVSPLVLVSMGLGLLCAVLARWMLPRRTRTMLLSSVPLVGRIWHWSGVAEFSRWLSLLLRAEVPLAEALRTASQQVENGDLSITGERLARRVEAGESLASAARSVGDWPLSSLPLLDWGARTGTLSDALIATAEMLEGRARSRARWIRLTASPITFVIIGVTIIGVFASLVIPNLQLLSALSG